MKESLISRSAVFGVIKFRINRQDAQDLPHQEPLAPAAIAAARVAEPALAQGR